MPAAPHPDDEAGRLAALRALEIMDSGPDPRFDTFVKLAADMYDVPIALVSLVDERRQWFKAGHGKFAEQTPRDSAFCAHAILNPEEVLVVEDASRDPRFADSPLVTQDPAIRFYAGAVVSSPSGHPLGTLCLMDRAPRTLDAHGRRRLAELAGGVSALLELHGLAADLHRAAHMDALTGLANRARFDMALDAAVASATHARPCALLLMDLDRFKWVNDSFGHLAGDALLRGIARRLESAIRPGDLCARFGGDEFAVLLPEPASRDVAEAIATRIEEALAAPMELEGQPYTARASIGVALCPHDAAAPGALLRAADQALYARKRRNTRRAADTGLRAALKSAVDSQSLTLHWQPVFHAATGALHGHEALRRWLQPGQEVIAPSVFLPVAEADGLIASMHALALNGACREASTWPGHEILAFNLCADWFGSSDLVHLISRTLAHTGLPAESLSIELAERTVLLHESIAASQIAALRKIGVQVVLDDFGAGDAGIALLRDLPFASIKLASSFTEALGESTRANAMIAGIGAMGHRMGVTVCAKGVETAVQLSALRRAGCDFLQGFMLGKPQPRPVHTQAAPAQ